MIPEASLRRVLSFNSKDWWLIALGVIGAMVVGTSFPVFSVVLAEATTRFTNVRSTEILQEIHPIAAAFLAIGFGLGVANFFKVPTCYQSHDTTILLRLSASCDVTVPAVHPPEFVLQCDGRKAHITTQSRVFQEYVASGDQLV